MASFDEYEVEKISKLIANDCKDSVFLKICWDMYPEKLSLSDRECINFTLNKVHQDAILSKGTLQKYYNNVLVPLNFSKPQTGKITFFERIDMVAETDIHDYLNYLNEQGLIPYTNISLVLCYLNNYSSETKELIVDVYNQKYWGDKLINEPRTLFGINIIIFKIGGFSIISIGGISHFGIFQKR